MNSTQALSEAQQGVMMPLLGLVTSSDYSGQLANFSITVSAWQAVPQGLEWRLYSSKGTFIE